jgi:hypothetical protein
MTADDANVRPVDHVREARYAEAITEFERTWRATTGEADEIPRAYARAVMAVADAEQAELRAEVERLQGELDVVKPVSERRSRELKVYAQRAWGAEERLRAVEALADRWDPPVTTALLQQGYQWDDEVGGMADELRAAIAPATSPAKQEADRG